MDGQAGSMLYPEEAAAIILHHVDNDKWRILCGPSAATLRPPACCARVLRPADRLRRLGDDALSIDAAVRADPDGAYEKEFMDLTEEGSPLRGAGEFQRGSKSQLAEIEEGAEAKLRTVKSS